ncbi:MAG: DUF898 domain-containing protein [Rubrivivax sp.]|nr:DUF898 domain-containing protein [Rubrivivax sp.]
MDSTADTPADTPASAAAGAAPLATAAPAFAPAPAPAFAPAFAPAPAPASEHRATVRFVGSGSEYFRIWIVNLLLTLVTLGLYHPFAKVRKLRYFHGATEIGGHALSFHANPWAMLRGYLLAGTMLALYAAAGHFSPTAGLVALVIVAALWPALWHSSLCFRLANTGWRGLRFRFTGSRGGAYGAMLPIGLVFVASVALGVAFAPEPGEPAGAPEPPLVAAAAMGLLGLAAMAGMPALLWALRRYQHQHYALGGEHSRFAVRLRSYYGVFALAVLMFLGVMIVAGIGAAIVAAIAMAVAAGRGAALAALPLAFALLYVVVLALVGAFVTARLQNITWNGTRSRHIGFDSQLGAAALARLNLKNWLLVVLTLGLYLPFAAVAMARLRLEAVTVLFAADPAALAAAGAHADESAAGDAAGDLFGFDIGL